MSSDFAPPPGPGRAPEPTSSRGSASGSADAPDSPRRRSLLRSGGGVALAAWIAIGAGLALLVGISWSAALAWSDRELATADIGATGDLHPLQLVPGMCLDGVGDDGAVGDAAVVPCDAPHRAEVFTSVMFSVAKFPGEDEIGAESLELCGDRIEGLLPDGSSWVAWAPSEASWARGDRVALCIAVFDSPREEPLSPAGIDAAEGDEPVNDGQDA
ncbi:septum formation family protein [Demequina muriae]|uniref:Septum formation family protein n=1 Tax=Demequina muriae TaxID=3051664 RepID=A0ABT8GGB0_9MICO|nr:septum formation family protein [Demequina sp. EGI L300058]MDN4480399.1 septum formation family protein [Demequina sp. EGI L300058]